MAEDGRNEDGTFKLGSAGGPGRPKKEDCLSDMLREMLKSEHIKIVYTTTKDGNSKQNIVDIKADKNFATALGAAMILEALDGNVQAFKEIADRVQGKAPIAITVNTDDPPAATTIKYNIVPNRVIAAPAEAKDGGE